MGAVPGLGACGTRWLAKSMLKHGTPAVYTYNFAHPEQVAIPHIPGTGPGSVIVPHAVEIPYVFNGQNQIAKGDEVELASQVSKYWTNFAANGDPNDASLPRWPKFDADTDMDMRLDVGQGGVHSEQHL